MTTSALALHAAVFRKAAQNVQKLDPRMQIMPIGDGFSYSESQGRSWDMYRTIASALYAVADAYDSAANPAHVGLDDNG